MKSNRPITKFQKRKYALINPLEFFSRYYVYDSEPAFGFCTVDHNGHKIKQVTKLASCRETVISHVGRQAYYKRMDQRMDLGTNKGYQTIKKSTPKKNLIRFDRTQILLKKPLSDELQEKYFEHGVNDSDVIKKLSQALSDPKNDEKKYEEFLLKSIKILNILERGHKWMKTKIYKINYDKKFPQELYMVIGSKRWMTAPPLLSLYLMILRSGHELTTGNFYSCRGLMKALDKKLAPIRQSSDGWGDDNGMYDNNDEFYAAMTYGYWILLLKNYKKLFKSVNMYNAYRTRKSGASNSPDTDGIYNLCNPDSNYGHEELKKNFMELVKEMGG